MSIPSPDFSIDESELDSFEHLLVAVYRLALRDAQAGDPQAADWLDSQIPEWRNRVRVDRHCVFTARDYTYRVWSDDKIKQGLER